MSAVCGKRSFFVDPLPPLSSKRIRCSSAAGSFSVSSLSYLIGRFPNMDKELLEKALHECGHDLDSTIKSLNELFLGSGENITSATGKPDATLEASSHVLNQGSTGSGDVSPHEQPSANNQPPVNREEFVDIFVREMMVASDIEDAKARASRALEVFEKSICSHASEAATRSFQQMFFSTLPPRGPPIASENIHIEFYFYLSKSRASRALMVFEKSICSHASEAASRSFQQENTVLRQQLETLLHENSILKRAVSIQHDRQKEYDERGREVNHLKQLLAQYQEQLRTLKVNNYALAMHLKQAQQSNSISGRFNPDIF